MPYELTIRALYPGDPAEIFDNTIQFDELKRVMEGVATYSGLPEGEMVQGETYVTTILFFGLFPVHNHVIDVLTLNKSEQFFETREHNNTARRWDHRLNLDPHAGGVEWVDHLVLDSGLTSWFTARWAAFIYTHRHRKRKALTITKTIKHMR